ncbi:uncharacterized protein LOC144471402 [Augochlora pura]
MKAIIWLCIFIISLRYVLSNNITTEETTLTNEIPDSVENQQSCLCKELKCSCCEYLDWKFVNVNGLVCAGVKYVTDVSVILSLTYNNITIIEQHIYLSKLHPICIKENIVGILYGSLCLYVYDVFTTPESFHACFNLTASISAAHVSTNLGCINIKKNIFTNIKFRDWFMCKIYKKNCPMLS